MRRFFDVGVGEVKDYFTEEERSRSL